MINFSRTTNQIVTQVEDRTVAPAPLHAPDKIVSFFGSKRKLTIVSRTSWVCGGAGAPALFTLCDNLICGIKKGLTIVSRTSGVCSGAGAPALS